MKLLGINNVGFDITDQLLITFFAFITYWRKSDWRTLVPLINVENGIKLAFLLE
jgi:hypothetical protein